MLTKTWPTDWLMRQITANLGWREWGRGGRGQGDKGGIKRRQRERGWGCREVRAMQQTMIKMEKERAWGRWMSLTYPLVVPIPGQIAFSAVVVSNLLIAPSCERERDWERERVREMGGGGECAHSKEQVDKVVVEYLLRSRILFTSLIRYLLMGCMLVWV